MAGSPEASTPAQRERKKPGRVPTSCAECRRLKLRCDRKVPCENCVKRGYGAICPTGSLTTGKGNRLAVANGAELHSKIESMSTRIRELEEGLRRAHAQTSDDSHPLLANTDSHAFQERTPSDSASIRASSSSEPEVDSVIDAFGTLRIGARGETSFMSCTARAEYLIGGPLKKASTWATLLHSSRLPLRVIHASILEHDVTPVDAELRELVMAQRPPLPEAIRLCEIYLEWAKTLWNSLSRQELLDEIVGSVYRADSYESIPGPHALSLLFSIFALASLFDRSRPPYSVEAYEYHILSRVALLFSTPCTTTTLQTVFALENHLLWLDFSDLEIEPSRSYIFVGLGVKLAYRMGLHLHSARFKLEKSVAQKRNILFWQMFMTDTLLSFGAGRPPNVSLDWVEAPYPEDEFPVKNDKGELEMGWRSWSWRFSRLIHEALVAAFGAKFPTYSTTLEFDRKIRDFPIPSHLQLQSINDAHAEPQVILQRLLVLRAKETVLLNLHRRYFSQALQESPHDPLKHRYGPSVMAIYRSAWRLIVSHSSAVDAIPDIAARMPILWSVAFSAAIVMCMIVTYAPNSNMAASSQQEIDTLYEVFKRAVPTTRIASVFWELIEKIWRKSHENVHHPRSDSVISRAELDRVGGGSTSLISQTSNTCPLPCCNPGKPSSDPQNPYSNSSDASPNSSFDLSPSSIHPRIMQDMQSFKGFQAPCTATRGHSSATPKQFSQSMIDTQLSHFCAETEAYKVRETLNQLPLSGSQPFHPSREMYPPPAEGFAMDSAWQSFMEQLGF